VERDRVSMSTLISVAVKRRTEKIFGGRFEVSRDINHRTIYNN